MNGVLILAHGSREKETEDILMNIVCQLRQQINNCLIETAFLQFSDTTLTVGLDRLKVQGINHIKIVPYFLFEGVHIRESVPKEIDKYLKENPNMQITIGQTFGFDPRLIEILADRVREII